MELSYDQIVLSGPIAVGKSAVSLLVAERLGLPCYEADRIKRYYYYKEGYDALAEHRVQEAQGTVGRAAFNKAHDLKAVECLLKEFHDCVIDLGGGHTCYLDRKLLRMARVLFEPLQNTFLLLPSRDREESLRILAERIRARREDVPHVRERVESLLHLNREYLKDRSYYELSKTIVYIDGRGPREVAEEVLGKMTFPLEKEHVESSEDDSERCDPCKTPSF